MKFTGTDNYVATEELQMAVNAAVTLQRPLLIKGEPGTGKTLLAEEVAKALGKPLLAWHIKSTTKAQQGLYEYDAVSRLRDSQLGSDKVQDIGNYISKGKLWEAFTADEQVVLLIDEILSVGDAHFRGKALAAMQGRITGDQTVVFVSHMADQVEKMCNRVIWLEHGKIVAEGDAKEVTSAYTQSVALASKAAIEHQA